MARVSGRKNGVDESPLLGNLENGGRQENDTSAANIVKA